MVGFLIGKCDSCNALVLDEIDERDPERVMCKGCGAKLMPFAGPGTIMKGTIWRSGMSRTKGWLSKLLIAFRTQHNRNDALGRHERVLNRHGDRYFEKVTLCESGEVTHLCEESLAEHQGHGSAKKRP